MASAAQLSPGHGPRRSILDLAPLELHCMNALWSLREGSVRQVQQALAPTVPRAYTTIMTIMDRLARKGVVTRFKQGRAYLYRASLSAEEARVHAIDQVVEGFFEGSEEALAAHLSGAHERMPASPQISGSAAKLADHPVRKPRRDLPGSAPAPSPEDAQDTGPQVGPSRGLDTTLL